MDEFHISGSEELLEENIELPDNWDSMDEWERREYILEELDNE